MRPAFMAMSRSCRGWSTARSTATPTPTRSAAAPARRSCRLARGLLRLGIRQGDRVGTLAWNNYRHFELYYGVSGIGTVCHTINPRLFDEQIVYVVNHAQDRLLFIETSFIPLVERLRPRLPADCRF